MEYNCVLIRFFVFKGRRQFEDGVICNFSVHSHRLEKRLSVPFVPFLNCQLMMRWNREHPTLDVAGTDVFDVQSVSWDADQKEFRLEDKAAEWEFQIESNDEVADTWQYAQDLVAYLKENGWVSIQHDPDPNMDSRYLHDSEFVDRCIPPRLRVSVVN